MSVSFLITAIMTQPDWIAFFRGPSSTIEFDQIEIRSVASRVDRRIAKLPAQGLAKKTEKTSDPAFHALRINEPGPVGLGGSNHWLPVTPPICLFWRGPVNSANQVECGATSASKNAMNFVSSVKCWRAWVIEWHLRLQVSRGVSIAWMKRRSSRSNFDLIWVAISQAGSSRWSITKWTW